MISTYARVLQQEQVARDCMLLWVEAPEVAARATAGQFAKLRCGSGFDPLLRRPLSFHAIDRRQGTVAFLYQVSGKGTTLLSTLTPGDRLDILGPLGNGFTLEQKAAVLVGGGVGIAPLYQLAADLAAGGNQVVLLYGAASGAGLYRLEVFQSLGVDLRVATEDGTAGFRGLVTDLLAELPGEKEKACAFYTCGPRAMMRSVALWAMDRDLPCQVSLESRMACGTGACLGCVRKLQDANSERGWRYGRVCSEGPVFPAGEVYWDD